jgi:hypothetical protein
MGFGHDRQLAQKDSESTKLVRAEAPTHRNRKIGTVGPESLRAGILRLHPSLLDAKIQHVYYSAVYKSERTHDTLRDRN